MSNYLGYFQAMILGFGLAFELPLLLVMLNLVGVISRRADEEVAPHHDLPRVRVRGIASPSPDPVTMLLLAIPWWC